MGSMGMPMWGKVMTTVEVVVDDKDNPNKINVGLINVIFTTYEGSTISYTYTGTVDQKLLDRHDFNDALKRTLDVGFIRESETRYISVKDIQYIDVEYLDHYIDRE